VTENMSKKKTVILCDRCGHEMNLPADAGVSADARSIADLRFIRPRKKGAGRRPSIDAAGVKRAEQMLFEGKEISDIAHQLHCSERTIRRVLNREHKFSNQPEA